VPSDRIPAGVEVAPYVPPALTEADYGKAIQGHVDATAQSKGYADGVTLAS